MAEPGGPTTQSGIYYQNTVSALYLGALLDSPHPSDVGTRVISVRIEAPEDVDDTIVTYSDSSCHFIQAKENLSLAGEPWDKFWAAAKRQIEKSTNESDQIRLVLGTLGVNLENLREALERAQGKLSMDEWLRSLNVKQKKIAASIEKSLATSSDLAFTVIRRTRVEFITLDLAETKLAKIWLPDSSETPAALLGRLRDCCGGAGRIRQQFHASDLSELLFDKFQVFIFGSQSDGLERYRQMLASRVNHISVPGTSISLEEAKLIIWPLVNIISKEDYGDFENEDPRSRYLDGGDEIDLKQFPNGKNKFLILESGAGQGKSTLIRATARRLATETSYVPALIHADALPELGTILDFLNGSYNLSYGVTIDWDRLCEQGRAVILIDGVDEIADDRRARLLEMLGLLAANFKEAPMMIGARDAAISAFVPHFSLCRVQRLNRVQMVAMLTSYFRARGQLDTREVIRHIDGYPELSLLCRIPLFLAIFVATLPKSGAIPTGRADLLERYIMHVLSPDRHKGVRRKNVAKTQLRRGAEAFAAMALERNESAVSEYIARACICNVLGDSIGDDCFDGLVQHGLLELRGSRVSFSIPTIQEYLAGCTLADSGRLDATDWLSNLYRRPWAQAFQFAVERIVSADSVLAQQLTLEDDIFYTSLRLTARCLVNGASVSPRLRAAVAERLVSAWISAGYSTCVKIGQLIEDGFCEPMHIGVRRALVTSERVSLSRPVIVARARESSLTLECLAFILSGDDIRELWSPAWLDALSAVLPNALEMLLNRSRETRRGNYVVEVIASVIYGLRNEHSIDWSKIFEDHTLPAVIRLAAKFASEKFDFVGDDELFRCAFLEIESSTLWSGFGIAYLSIDGWKDHLRGLFLAPPEEQSLNPFYLIHDFDDGFQNQVEFLSEIARDPRTQPIHIQRLRLTLGVYGQDEFARASTEYIAVASAQEAITWSQYACYFSEDIARYGVELLLAREFLVSDGVMLLVDLYELGMSRPAKRRDGAAIRGYYRLEEPSFIANLVIAKARELFNSGTLSIIDKRSLINLLAEHGDREDLERLREEMNIYLDCHQLISSEDWSLWFAHAIGIGNRIKLDISIDRLWQILDKSNGLPMHEIIKHIAKKLGSESYEALANYVNLSPYSNVWQAVYFFLEENAERNGLKVQRVENILTITKL
ncbi:NACHT domain-containing NTPase [Janthinobacterium sp. LM6]|uniref:NACHT domain-containing protein n=1 Tax=Janthinobacterium sp. LM6 TaxID=1938606 RepID=UPI0012375943|nr:hypothetical protein [Janthinobacterium sp. LM6]